MAFILGAGYAVRRIAMPLSSASRRPFSSRPRFL